MKYPSYPEYKESGVEWLGAIPKDWISGKLKYITRFAYGDSLSESVREEGEVLVYGSNGPVGAHVIANTQSPCIVVGRKGSYGKLQYSDDAVFAIDTTYFIDHSQSVHNLKYLYYLLSCIGLDSVSKDTGVPGLSREDAYQNYVPIIPLDEQESIANFLDTKTTLIDDLIAKKEKQIELLKEKRTAIINRAVTKGLDPNVPMKDSGFEWLGEIPEHWKATKLKFAATKIVDCPHETPVYDPDGEYLVIRTADVSEGVLDLSNAYRLVEEEYLKRTRRLSLEPDDIVYGREGERYGFAALIPNEVSVCLGQRMMQFRADQHFSPSFLMWQLNSNTVYRQGQIDTVGATSPHVNVETIRNYILTEPPLAEQFEIAKYILIRCTNIDTLVSMLITQIEKLREYRLSLLSSVVTGKIDVRETVQDC